jgi:hypothetical protein
VSQEGSPEDIRVDRALEQLNHIRHGVEEESKHVAIVTVACVDDQMVAFVELRDGDGREPATYG